MGNASSNRFSLFGALKTGMDVLSGGMKLLGQMEYNKGRQRGAQVGLLSQVDILTLSSVSKANKKYFRSSI